MPAGSEMLFQKAFQEVGFIISRLRGFGRAGGDPEARVGRGRAGAGAGAGLGVTGPTPTRVLRAAARPTQTRDDCLSSAGAGAAEGGDRRSTCRLPGVPVPPRLPRPAWAAGRRGWARDNGPGAREQLLWAEGRAPREGAEGAPGPRSARGAGTPPPHGRRGGRRGLRAAGRRTSAHLDEELDDGLFVLLLQPVQRHRQRHGRLGCAPWTAAAVAAPAPGLLGLRAPAALRLPGQSRCGARLSLACPTPPHAPRATRRRPQPEPLQAAGRGPGAGLRRGGGGGGAKACASGLWRKWGGGSLGGVASGGGGKEAQAWAVGGRDSEPRLPRGREGNSPGGRSLTPPPAAARASLRSCCWLPAR